MNGGGLTLFVSLYLTRSQARCRNEPHVSTRRHQFTAALQKRDCRAYREMYHAAAWQHQANIATHGQWRLDLLGCN